MSRKTIFTILICLLPMLLQAQTLTKYEYWFDDNYAGRRAGSLSGTEDEIDINVATAQLQAGLHKLRFRVKQSDGMYSPVSTSFFFKIPEGGISILEYWIDGDYENARTIGGHQASGSTDYIFVSDLDLGDVSPGHHRLSFCAKGTDGQIATAATTVPIIVKSRYNVENPEATQMTYYSIAVDNEEPVELSFPHPDTVVDLNHYLDARRLSKGKHQLKLKMANSFGAGANLEQEFTVDEVSEPSIALTATAKDGLVSIRFNSVPNDNGYRIYRVDANGMDKIVRFERVGHYPSDICYTDNPPAGTYTYFAMSVYTDMNGKSQHVESNEVSVTVAQQHSELGFVEGEIYYDGKRKVGHRSNLMFSDGVVVQSNEDGVFRRDRIPVGKELGVYLTDNEHYMSDVARVTVVKGRNYARVNAMKRFEGSVNDQEDYSHLSFAGNVTWEPGAFFKFRLTYYEHEAWNGRLCVKAIPKRLDNEEETPSVGYDNAQVLPGSVAPMPFSYTTNYQLFYSDDFHMTYGDLKEIVVPLTGFQNSGPTELFNFYVYSINADGAKSLVWTNHRYDTVRNNPLSYMIEGGMAGEDKVSYFTNLIIYFCSTVKEVDKIIGKASDVLRYKKKYLEDEYWNLTQITNESQLETEGLQEVVEFMIKDCDEFSNEVKSFRSKIAPIVRECKSIITLWGYVKNAISAVKEYKGLTKMNDYEKSIYLSKKVIELTEEAMGLGNPFSPILGQYLDITKTTIQNVLNLGWAYNQPWIPIDMSENKLKIKIKVENPDGGSINFKWKGCHIIDHVVVKGWNKSDKDIAEARFKNVSGSILDWHCAVFEQEGTDNISKLDLGGATPFEQLWAEVYWRNGRVSCVPLNDVGQGISYEHAEQSNSIFTITFQSATDDYTHAADVIHLKE